MKDRIIFKQADGKMCSIPKDGVMKNLGEDIISSTVMADLWWHLDGDYISSVDEQLFPEEFLI